MATLYQNADLTLRSTLREQGLGRRREKPLAIVPRRNLQGTEKGEAHLLFATEPALFSDGGDSVLGLFKPTTSCIQSNGFDRLGRCATALLHVDARKVSRAHVNPLGELLDCNVPLQVLGDPLFELAEALRFRFSLRRQQGAVLRLATGTFQIDHQDTGNIHRDFSPSILLD